MHAARTAATTLILAACALVGTGCGPVALIHDAYLGPISPAGRTHPLVAGQYKRFGSRAIGATATGRGLLRPFAIERFIGRGNAGIIRDAVERRLSSLSFVIDGGTIRGRTPDDDAIGTLAPRLSEEDVLDRLGPPDLWIRRKESRLMAWQRDRDERLRIRIGVPPGIPIPGASNLAVTWYDRDVSRYRLLVLFDNDGKLVEWFRRDEETTR